jgi:hypothetical protein
MNSSTPAPTRTKTGMGGGIRLTDLLALTHVPRWAIVAMRRPQSVGEHIYRTLIIFTELCEAVGWEVTAPALYSVLTHDAQEARTSDIPGSSAGVSGFVIPELSDYESPVTVSDVAWRAATESSPWLVEERKRFLFATSPVDCALLKLADHMEAHSWLVLYGDGPMARRLQDRCWRTVLTDIESMPQELFEDNEVFRSEAGYDPRYVLGNVVRAISGRITEEWGR